MVLLEPETRQRYIFRFCFHSDLIVNCLIRSFVIVEPTVMLSFCEFVSTELAIALKILSCVVSSQECISSDFILYELSVWWAREYSYPRLRNLVLSLALVSDFFDSNV